MGEPSKPVRFGDYDAYSPKRRYLQLNLRLVYYREINSGNRIKASFFTLYADSNDRFRIKKRRAKDCIRKSHWAFHPIPDNPHKNKDSFLADGLERNLRI
jgi:hypothetical protein